MTTTINNVLKAHDRARYGVAKLDRSVKHMHQINFFWVLSMAEGLNLTKSFGECSGKGSSLRAKTIEMLSISIFVAPMTKHKNRTNIKIKYVSDNFELINKSKDHNTTLSAEYDITEQIYLMNKTY